jgi:hypothetical protein
MRTARNTPDLTPSSDRRRIVVVLAAAVALPLVLMAAVSLVGPDRHPALVSWIPVLVVVALLATRVVVSIRGRRTRESTDERAVDLHRRAASFAWQVTGVALLGVLLWTGVRHGSRAAEPYAALLTVLVGSYVAALLWRRWRGF